MTTTKRRVYRPRKLYCTRCDSTKPLWKAGIHKTFRGEPQQQYKCPKCHHMTVNPRKTPRKTTLSY